MAFVGLEYNRKLHSELGCATTIERFLKDPNVVRDSPTSDDLRSRFRMRATRRQRRSDGTLTAEGIRFEIPSRFRHLEKVSVRYARWDMSCIELVDERNNVSLATLYPLNKTKNANAQRRRLEPIVGNETPPVSGIAPHLKKLLADYSALGLPPAYLPSEDDKT